MVVALRGVRSLFRAHRWRVQRPPPRSADGWGLEGCPPRPSEGASFPQLSRESGCWTGGPSAAHRPSLSRELCRPSPPAQPSETFLKGHGKSPILKIKYRLRLVSKR